jgi:tetratricopeptide (TPR) repeat protein
MVKPLSQNDIEQLQRAQALTRQGQADSAEALVRGVLAASSGQPDALNLLAFILQAQGRRAEARTALESALKIAPKHSPLWNSLGNLLGDMGETDAAIAALERAVGLAPTYGEGWINLGVTASAAGRWELARRALGKATQIHPERAQLWSALGQAEQVTGNVRHSVDAYTRALNLNGEDKAARHNLAVGYRKLDRPADALAVLAAAEPSGGETPQTLTLRAHLLADVGRFADAVAAYEQVIWRYPDHVDAHETLARLLPTLGQSTMALDTYKAALAAAPHSLPLWQSALGSARDLQAYDLLRTWAETAEKALGPRFEFRLARAAADALAGDAACAIVPLRTLIADHPLQSGPHAYLAHIYLRLGDAIAAETHAVAATQLAPSDQTGWALLSLIWRLLGDSREHWLADYDRLVIPIDIDAPAPYTSRSAFLSELAATLTGMHEAQRHPAEQSLRGGTQTRGILFERRAPVLQALAAQIRRQVVQRLEELQVDASHPFLSKLTQDITYAGSWSVRLASEGFHISHIHPQGWLSSAFYVEVPSEVGAAGAALPAGALAFGIPDSALGLTLTPRRVEVPVAGRLVIFPSYFWHGTIPFTSTAHRLTVAFDAVPA